MKKFTVWMVMLLVLLLVAGCSEQGQFNPVKPPEPAKAVEQKPKDIKTQDFTVYRVPKNGAEILVPEKVKFAVGTANTNQAETALKALVNTEPTSKTTQNLFPAGTKVDGVKVKDGIAYADFNKAFAKKGQGSYSEVMMVNAIVATLTEVPGVKKVQILVEGQKITTLNGHLDLEEPLERNDSFLKTR